MSSFASKDIDAIIIDTMNSSAINSTIVDMCRRGVVVVVLGQRNNDDCAYYFSTDYYELGNLKGQWLGDILPDGGKLLEIRGRPGFPADEDHHRGLREALDSTGRTWEIIEVYGEWEQGQSQKAVADALVAHGAFDALVGDDNYSEGAMRALIDARSRVSAMIFDRDRNGIRSWVEAGLSNRAVGLSSSAGRAVFALWAARLILDGKELARDIAIPLWELEPSEFATYAASDDDDEDECPTCPKSGSCPESSEVSDECCGKSGACPEN
jgi:ribose transport system substrate-binding protein